MDGAVKMPGAQIKVNPASQAQRTAQASETGVDFIKLLQAKGSETKAPAQEKTGNSAKTPSKDANTKETSSSVTDKNQDTSLKKPDVKEEAADTNAEDMAQQAAMQQTAALIAGMFTDPQEAAAEVVTEPQELPIVGDLLNETVSPAPIPEAVQTPAELSPAEVLPETPAEVLPEAALPQQAPVQETPKQPEQPAQTEPLQPEANEAAAKTPKPEESKPSETKPENHRETVQNTSDTPKPEETTETSETGRQSAQQDLTRKDTQEAEGITTSESEAGQVQAAGAETFHVFGNQQQDSFFGQKTGTVSMKTTPETLPEDLGKTLGAKFADGARTLTVELEPASLGKLTIRLSYEGDRAAVSIIATNPKTLELLNQKASEIAAILEEKTGQQTIIFTQKPETNEENYDRNPDGKRDQEDREEKKQDKEDHHQMESFAQQLRLGLV